MNVQSLRCDHKERGSDTMNCCLSHPTWSIIVLIGFLTFALVACGGKGATQLFVHSQCISTAQMKNCAMKFDAPSIMITECSMMLFQLSSPDLFTLAMYTITWVTMVRMIPVMFIQRTNIMAMMMVMMFTTMMLKMMQRWWWRCAPSMQIWLWWWWLLWWW